VPATSIFCLQQDSKVLVAFVFAFQAFSFITLEDVINSHTSVDIMANTFLSYPPHGQTHQLHPRLAHQVVMD